MTWAWLPTSSELRAMLKGAGVGARLAVGPKRWSELRPAFVVASVCANVLASIGILCMAFLFLKYGMAWGFEWVRNN